MISICNHGNIRNMDPKTWKVRHQKLLFLKQWCGVLGWIFPFKETDHEQHREVAQCALWQDHCRSSGLLCTASFKTLFPTPGFTAWFKELFFVFWLVFKIWKSSESIFYTLIFKRAQRGKTLLSSLAHKTTVDTAWKHPARQISRTCQVRLQHTGLSWHICKVVTNGYER